MVKYISKTVALSAIVALSISGCANRQDVAGGQSDAEQKIANLEKQISDKDAKISALQAQRGMSTNGDMNAVSNSLVPPNAKPGECYSKVLVPAKYETKEIKKLAKESSENISIIPATYRTEDKVVTIREESTKLVAVPATYKKVEEKILVRPESKKIVTVPATYKVVEQTVMVEPEKTTLVTVPATYKTETEKILVKDAYTTWKKGRGEIEKVNNTTGDIMCLVQVPAVYKTVTRKVVDTPATTRKVVVPAVMKVIKRKVVDTPATSKEVTVPAVYKTITKTVVDAPATTRKVVIPAVTKVVKTKVLATPAKEVKKEVPAIYKTVKVKEKVAEPYLRWQEILCETNTTPDVISKLQRALRDRNYDIPVDGRYGVKTREAVRSYQKKQGMNEGALTLKTLKSLGVM